MSTTWDRIAAFFASKGLTPAQIAGIGGNLKIESGFDPTAYNPREGAIGLAQWEGPRRPALQQYAASVGLPETNLDAQLGFMWQELQTTERGALSSLLAARTPAEAATVFDQQYERSAGTSRQQRIDAANVIGGGGSFAGTGTTGTGTASESLIERLNPFDNWVADALQLGTKLLLTGAAVALVIVGATKSVKDD